jgi:hypothetical protein
MKWKIILSILSVLLIAGCSKTETKEFENSADGSAVKIRFDDSIAQANSFTPAKTDFVQIKEKAGKFNKVDVFVTWLKTRTNVSNIIHNRMTVLTSNPPKHVVSFSLDGVRHKLLLSGDVDSVIIPL